MYDWRSPIAGIFYRFMKGEAFYDAPCGRVTGELGLKRQYEIKNGTLEYYFDAQVQIVETIRQEQDVVIRDMENDLLMVQGVAGSGKTSIALHRAAYLMYQGLQTKLSSNNIMIISPNTIFEQYISNVLPELREDNVVSVVFEDILHTIIKGRKIQPKNKFLESMIAHSDYKELYKRSIEFKTSEPFLEALDRFVSDIPKRWMEFDDAIAIAYLYLKIYGTNEYKNIKQVVIDEAQDYYPLQYELFHLLFPNAKFTILRDMKQTLAKKEDLSLYEQIQKILNKKKSSLIVLNKSFRCTNEILNFSLQFIDQTPQIKSFNRNGDNPEVFIADRPEAFTDKITQEITLCQEKGFQSIGLICKTEKNSIQLYEKLKHLPDIQLIEDESVSALQGVFIIPVYMSKGLEFDAVIICDADSQNYHDEDAKNLLYVACTRALHRLSLFCENEISPLV